MIVEDPDNFNELLAGYVAGELSDIQQAEVRAALARSPQLRSELERYRQLFLLLTAAAAHDVDVPARLHHRIARQITLQYYLKVLTTISDDLLGFYGRALAFYLGLR